MKNLKMAAFVVALVVLAGVAAAQSADPKPFLGDWKGTISIMGAELEIGLHFKLDEANKITGTFDSITQGAMGLPLGAIEIKGKDATFVLSGVPGDPAFKGTIDATGTKLSGEFSQSGYAGTFAVEKQ
ncbi:MAG: hypothetical protein KA243_05570 [Candidatus Aminicenantes bacterium]|nr:hypothetical protein [Candidatus Aminicenantes bacterium]